MNTSTAENQEILELLASFGLNDKDSVVYLALLPLGAVTLSPVARATGLPLTTVQSVLPRLVKRGLVRVTQRKSRHVFEAVDPIVLRRLLERQLEEASGIIPLLQKMRVGSTGAPKLRIYYKERATDIFHLTLKAKSKVVYEIVAARDIQKILGEKFHYTRRRVKAGVRLKSLRVEAAEIKKYNAATHTRELREARFLPRELTFRGSIMFWDNTVAFFGAGDEGLAWTVESPAIREMQQQMFNLLWSVGRRMETMPLQRD